MSNNPFRFKQFTVQQDKCAMKVGTDGVLLGAWAKCKNSTRVLDIGTGTGLIALMLAQRCPATIDALEIDGNAAQQARQNFKNSPWGNRLNAIHVDARFFQPAERYDLIVSNPPFFENNHKIEQQGRRLARTGVSLKHKTIIDLADEWLVEEGRLAIICPASSFELIEEYARQKHMRLTSQVNVRGNPNTEIVRCLLEFSLKPNRKEISELVIEEERHHFTDEYSKLTKAFYLNML